MIESRNLKKKIGDRGGDIIEMISMPEVKFSIIGEEDEMDEEEGGGGGGEGGMRAGEGLEEQEEVKEGNYLSSPGQRSIVQRLLATSTPNISKESKGQYAKVSLTDDSNADISDLTDNETVGESSSRDRDLTPTGKGLKLSDLSLSSLDDSETADQQDSNSKRSRSCSCRLCCWVGRTVPTSGQGEKEGDSPNVLCERVVLLTTINYGLLAMAYILVNETVPLFLKLDSKEGGFSLNSSDIGTLLSLSGFSMLFFTYFLLPRFASQHPIWLFRLGALLAIPFSFGWPLAAIVNEKCLVFLPDLSHTLIKWGLLGIAFSILL